MYILLKFKKKTVEERREKKFTEHTVLEERKTNEQLRRLQMGLIILDLVM